MKGGGFQKVTTEAFRGIIAVSEGFGLSISILYKARPPTIAFPCETERRLSWKRFLISQSPAGVFLEPW
jgi:hypothetical protein